MNWKQISAILVAVTVLGSAIATVNKYRFWASAGALILVADTAYGADLKLLSQRWTEIQFLIQKCKDTKCGDLKILEQMQDDVEKQMEEKKDELKKLKGG